jgi:hypothetical protein
MPTNLLSGAAPWLVIGTGLCTAALGFGLMLRKLLDRRGCAGVDSAATPKELDGYPGVGVRPTWEPWLVALLTVMAIGFGALVEYRSAFSQRRRTDAGVYFRAGYAYRVALDPYRVSDDNRWYFLYPPAIAPLFAPLADPVALQGYAGGNGPARVQADDWRIIPPPALRGWHPPYVVSIAVWYAIGIACALLSVECLSRALIGGSPDPLVRAMGPKNGGWWNVRLWPLLMCLPDICATLSRGQIELVLLACISAGILLMSRARSFWGGVLLSIAACTKVLPGILVLDVISRRGRWAMAGYAACAAAMMIVLPVAFYGPARATRLTREWEQRVLLAGVLGTPDRLQAGAEFTDTDNHSIQGSLHNLLNIRTPRGCRPPEPRPWIKAIHVAAGLGLAVATLLIGRRRSRECEGAASDTAMQIMLRAGMLCAVMVMAAPMCHRHYFVFLMPALAALTFTNLMGSRLAVPNGWGAWLIPLYPMAMTLPRLAEKGTLDQLPAPLAPWLSSLGVRDWPIPVLTSLAVWLLCARLLAQLSRPGAGSDSNYSENHGADE